MKTIDVNIIPSIVTGNTQLISKVGANVGTQIFKVDVRYAWQGGKEGFEKDKRAIELGEKHGFILNRSPRRLLAKNILIAGVCLVEDVDGEVCIAINPKEGGNADMVLPINEKTLDIMGKTTADAIKEAIKGEKDHFFLDGKTLVSILNAAVKKEVQYLEELKENITKMIGTLNADIKLNEKKAQEVAEAWSNSALPVDVQMPSGVNGSNVHITVNNE
jgi:hypothetical protein